MIYTVTFNPSLDYTISVNRFAPGRLNRASSELIRPGGKGINVSIMLSRLGVKSVALGFVSGFVGDELERGVRRAGCKTDFIKTAKGMTRINVKIRSDEMTEVNGAGPALDATDLQALCERLAKLGRDDMLVLSGSVPAVLPDSTYADIMRRLAPNQTSVVVDAEKGLLLKTLEYGPFLIKPNHRELGELFGVAVDDAQSAAQYGKKLQAMGARNVLVSMAERGAVLVAETGEVFQRDSPRGTALNPVGAGDSMIAGFLAGYLRSQSYEYAFKAGVAAGSATAFCEWLAEEPDVDRVFNELDR